MHGASLLEVVLVILVFETEPIAFLRVPEVPVKALAGNLFSQVQQPDRQLVDIPRWRKPVVSGVLAGKFYEKFPLVGGNAHVGSPDPGRNFYIHLEMVGTFIIFPLCQPVMKGVDSEEETAPRLILQVERAENMTVYHQWRVEIRVIAGAGQSLETEFLELNYTLETPDRIVKIQLPVFKQIECQSLPGQAVKGTDPEKIMSVRVLDECFANPTEIFPEFRGFAAFNSQSGLNKVPAVLQVETVFNVLI